MTFSSTSTPVTPGTADSAASQSAVMVPRRGQPAMVRSTAIRTRPPSETSTASTMPSSVMGRRSSGSITVARAACTAPSKAEAGEVPGVLLPWVLLSWVGFMR